MYMKRQSRFPRTLEQAFSLIELLVVVAVFSLMAVLVAPSLGSLAGAGGTTQAINDMSGVLDHARLNAMQMSTWVWVGIEDTTEHGTGEPRLTFVEVMSRDGSKDLSSANLMQTLRPTHVKRVKLSTEADPAATVLGSRAGGFEFDWTLPSSKGAPQVVKFSKFVVGFSPRGEAVISDQALEDWIKIRFVSGNNEANQGAVLVSGPSGQVVAAR